MKKLEVYSVISPFTDGFTIMKDGSIRAATKFEYLGGEYVDVFYKDDSNELTDGTGLISHLLDRGINIDGLDKAKQFFDDTCKYFGVIRRGGELVKKFDENFSDPRHSALTSYMKLGQASVIISHAIINLVERKNNV